MKGHPKKIQFLFGFNHCAFGDLENHFTTSSEHLDGNQKDRHKEPIVMGKGNRFLSQRGAWAIPKQQA